MSATQNISLFTINILLCALNGWFFYHNGGFFLLLAALVSFFGAWLSIITLLLSPIVKQITPK